MWLLLLMVSLMSAANLLLCLICDLMLWSMAYIHRVLESGKHFSVCSHMLLLRSEQTAKTVSSLACYDFT